MTLLLLSLLAFEVNSKGCREVTAHVSRASGNADICFSMEAKAQASRRTRAAGAMPWRANCGLAHTS